MHARIAEMLCADDVNALAIPRGDPVVALGKWDRGGLPFQLCAGFGTKALAQVFAPATCVCLSWMRASQRDD